MIVDIVKYLILGAKEDLDRFFEIAQEQGFLEFISVSGKKSVETPITIQSLLSAIKILRRQPLRETYLGGGDLPFAMQIAERVLDLKEDIEKLKEEKRMLEAEVSRVHPFGDFSMDDIAFIEKEGGRKVQFFCMKAAKSHKTNCADEIIYIGTEYDLDYFITFNTEAKAYPKMIEMRIDSSLGELENRLSFVDDAISRYEGELKEYAGHIEFLQAVLIEEMNRHNLSGAKKEVSYPLENSLFAIEAWLPKNKVATLFGILDGMAIHAEEIALGKEDRVPTCMENRGMRLVGEDLVKIYDIPSIEDKDPSGWVVWFFPLFFALIVADAGYGFLFLAAAFYLKYKFPKMGGAKRRALKLLFILASFSVVWGVMTCAYFGLKVEPGSFLSRISPLHYLVEQKASYHFALKDDVYASWVDAYSHLAGAESGREFLRQAVAVKKSSSAFVMLEEFSNNILMEFTIVVGIVHLIVGLLRYVMRNLAGIGWIAFLIGGYLYFPGMLDATTILNFTGLVDKSLAAAIGKQLLYGGIGFAVLAALIQKRLKGLGEIANMVQVFADALSYLRLYALSLASTIMAGTFNSEGSALGLVGGAIVILGGHLVNIVLAFQGGVIHGLRLNFLEWYHYCFDGGGKLFNPLHKIKMK